MKTGRLLENTLVEDMLLCIIYLNFRGPDYFPFCMSFALFLLVGEHGLLPFLFDFRHHHGILCCRHGLLAILWSK